MLTESPADPTFVLSRAVAAAVVRDADEDGLLAMLRAASAIANGDERAARRFAYCMASAIVDELRNSLDCRGASCCSFR
jgi:hypothetical protein